MPLVHCIFNPLYTLYIHSTNNCNKLALKEGGVSLLTVIIVAMASIPTVLFAILCAFKFRPVSRSVIFYV